MKRKAYKQWKSFEILFSGSMAGLFWLYFFSQNEILSEIVKLGIDFFVIEIFFLISFILNFRSNILWNGLFSFTGINLVFFLIFLSGNLNPFSEDLPLSIFLFSGMNFLFIEFIKNNNSIQESIEERTLKIAKLGIPAFLMFFLFFLFTEKITEPKAILLPLFLFCIQLFQKMSEGTLQLWLDEMEEFIALITSFPIATVLYFFLGGRSVFTENTLHFYALLFYSTLFLLHLFDNRLILFLKKNGAQKDLSELQKNE